MTRLIVTFEGSVFTVCCFYGNGCLQYGNLAGVQSDAARECRRAPRLLRADTRRGVAMTSSIPDLAVVLGCLAGFVSLVLAWARVRYRSGRRILKAKARRRERADKLLDALAGTLRATANPDAIPATLLNPEEDHLVRPGNTRTDPPSLRRWRLPRVPACPVRSVCRRTVHLTCLAMFSPRARAPYPEILVYTDIEDSTKAADEYPAAMIVVQEVHDRVMRQGIARFAGYEIHTQGDAFEMAFATAVSAVQFCLWAQDQLKNAEWSKLVLRVPQFAEQTNELGDVVFRGPRVRMGVHAAAPGSWLKGTHGYTHHTVFGGEGVDIVAAVSDAGAGGQVILTKDAANALFPRIHKVDALLESIGTFRILLDETKAVDIELLDCQPLPTPHRPHRPFTKELRRLQRLAPGRSLAVIPPPSALEVNQRALEVANAGGGYDGEDVFIVVIRAEACVADNPELADALAGILAQQAQLAGGYLASPDACAPGGAVIVFNAQWGAAPRFLAVLPVVLVWSDWPKTAPKRVVMHGQRAMSTVRVAMAMHVSNEVRLKPDQSTKRRRLDGEQPVNQKRRSREITRVFKGVRESIAIDGFRMSDLVALSSDVDLEAGDSHMATAGGGVRVSDLSDQVLGVEGFGLDTARALCIAASPGQVVLTTAAWQRMQGRAPAGAYPLSLGTHIVTKADAAQGNAQELYELVSGFLGRVPQPRLRTYRPLTPGYRQSPDPGRPVASVFVSLAAPDRDSSVTTAALLQAGECLRSLVGRYRGYECKSPEPNKYTLAFESFAVAVRFCGALHLELLAVRWSVALLAKPGCSEERDPETGALIWRGLHARCGIAFGLGSTRKPLNTGRADYFGAIPNLAARICAISQYGQTLIEATQGLKGAMWDEDEVRGVLDEEDTADVAGGVKGLQIELQKLGSFALRGVSKPVTLAQALPEPLARGRSATFKVPAGRVDPADRAKLLGASVCEQRALRGRARSSGTFQELVEANIGCVSRFFGRRQPRIGDEEERRARQNTDGGVHGWWSAVVESPVKRRMKASLKVAAAARKFGRKISRKSADPDAFHTLENILTVEEAARADDELQHSFRRA